MNDKEYCALKMLSKFDGTYVEYLILDKAVQERDELILTKDLLREWILGLYYELMEDYKLGYDNLLYPILGYVNNPDIIKSHERFMLREIYSRVFGMGWKDE